MSIEWDEIRNEVADLVEWMEDTGRISRTARASAVVRHPWKFEPEYRQMLRDRKEAAEILSRRWPDDGSREQAAEAVTELVGD